MSSRLRRSAAPPVLLVLASIWGVLAAAPSGRSAGPLRAFLPDDRSVTGWVRDGEPQEFEGGDLYTYIDGGADIYEEYGFTRVIVQDYKSDKDRSVSLEIFEMASPAAAFGMFTFKRSGQGEILALGGGAELESYYLNFWKDRFLVTLTGFDEAVETVSGLAALGRTIAAKLPGGGEPPPLVSALPGTGLDPRSVKYLRGLLGLNNVFPLYTAAGLDFRDAVRALYDSGETLIVLEYGTAEARHRAWVELRAGLEKSGRFERATNTLADAVAFKDPKGPYIAIGEAGTRLAIGVHPTLDGALSTVARVR
ncbi:MAG TPA: DUF6599 family protein [Acidobacteriota bacterium]|nr:DUF6599 family protein [Acidobacteriota bacterium]